MHLVNASVLEEWDALSDAQVAAQVLMGRTALFEVLMRRHNERVYRLARALVGNDSTAEKALGSWRERFRRHDKDGRTRETQHPVRNRARAGR